MSGLLKKILAFALVLCLFSGSVPGAAAEEDGEEESGDSRFLGKTWDEVTEEFMAEHYADHDHLSIGYCNTVTGEEHYFNPDAYMIAASLYKVPLNMIFAEKIAAGEMDWSTEISCVPYEILQEYTIVNSNNDMAEILWRAVGTYREYREYIAPYMGEDAETVDPMYYRNNYFTARQMIHCLRLLYDNPQRFPRIIDLMKRAQPDNYFLAEPKPVTVAHKYGYLADETGFYLNDCAICYTEEPFCLVVFTSGIHQPNVFLTEYCALMVDYNEYHTRLDRCSGAVERESLRIMEQLASAVAGLLGNA